jgi:P pilus assembly chaperone PapD
LRAIARAVAVVSVWAIVGWPAPASAQVSIEATPLRLEITGQPGASYTHSVTLTNPGNETVRVRAAMSDWHLSREGAPQFQAPVPGRPFAAASWVRFAPPEFVLEPGKQGIVRFTIEVPSDVQPGGYRTGLLFDFIPDSDLKSHKARQIVLRGRIATLVYVHIGNLAADVDLTNLQVRGTGEQMQIVASLKNTSRRSVRTKGTLVLYDSTGVAASRITVPDVPILPESERDLAISVSDSSPPLVDGTYKVELKLDVGMPALLVGETTLRRER